MGFQSNTQVDRDGLLFVGHGTRNSQGLAEFQALSQQVAELGPEFDVQPCHLELAQPDIGAGVRQLLERGMRRIVVSPVLLFAAGHAKRDIPAAVESAIALHKAATVDRGAITQDLLIHQVGALECHPQIIELSTQRFHEAVADCALVDPAETLLIMVGRGSSMPEAIGRMHQFAQLRSQTTPVGRVETCFVAMATPTLDETLAWAAETQHRRVVVQPHLLFVGDVLAEITAAVAELAARQPQREWIVTPHLGPSPQVAEAILDLARNLSR
jgi:sirohydrochlorin cobaltochelatase